MIRIQQARWAPYRPDATRLEPCRPASWWAEDEPEATGNPGAAPWRVPSPSSRSDDPLPTNDARSPRSSRLAAVALVVAIVALAVAALAFRRPGVVPRPVTNVPAPAAVPSGASVSRAMASPEPTPWLGAAATAIADQPSLASYVPRVGVERHSSDGDVVPVDAEVTRSATGRYTVVFHGLAAPDGTAHAYPYSSIAGCAAVDWAKVGPDEHVDVVCEHQGVLTDSPFEISFSDSP